MARWTDVTPISHICCNIRDAGAARNTSELLKKKKKITLLCTLRRWGFSCFMNVSIWLRYNHKLPLKIIYLHILKARDLSIPLLDDRKKLLKNNILHMYKLKLFIPENILVFLLIKCVHCGNKFGISFSQT